MVIYHLLKYVTDPTTNSILRRNTIALIFKIATTQLSDPLPKLREFNQIFDEYNDVVYKTSGDIEDDYLTKYHYNILMRGLDKSFFCTVVFTPEVCRCIFSTIRSAVDETQLCETNSIFKTVPSLQLLTTYVIRDKNIKCKCLPLSLWKFVEKWEWVELNFIVKNSLL